MHAACTFVECCHRLVCWSYLHLIVISSCVPAQRAIRHVRLVGASEGLLWIQNFGYFFKLLRKFRGDLFFDAENVRASSTCNSGPTGQPPGIWHICRFSYSWPSIGPRPPRLRRGYMDTYEHGIWIIEHGIWTIEHCIYYVIPCSIIHILCSMIHIPCPRVSMCPRRRSCGRGALTD